VNPLTIVTSTVGPIQAGPLWELFQCAEADDEAVRLIYQTENMSPLISEEFLERQRAILPSFVYSREHENLWGEGSDAFCSIDDWDRATKESPLRDGDVGPCAGFVDLGWTHDETALAVAKHSYGEKVTDVLHLSAFRGTQSSPVQMVAVEEKLRELISAFNVRNLEIESPQGLAMAQSLASATNARLLYPTAKSNQERWGLLYTLLKNGGVRLPRDAKLRRQLLTLTIKESPTGWKVVDIPSIHNDRAVAVAGAVHLARKGAGVSLDFGVDHKTSRWLRSSGDDEAPLPLDSPYRNKFRDAGGWTVGKSEVFNKWRR